MVVGNEGVLHNGVQPGLEVRPIGKFVAIGNGLEERFLQAALDSARSSGEPAGEPVAVPPPAAPAGPVVSAGPIEVVDDPAADETRTG